MAPHPNDNHNTALISVAAVSVSLSWAGLMGRMISMRMMRLTVRPDDLLLFFAFACCVAQFALTIWATLHTALGRHLSTSSPVQISDFQKFLFAAELLQPTLLFLAKLSVLYLLRRIFVTRPFRITIVVITTIISAWWIGIFFAQVFDCWPINSRWDSSVAGVCGNAYTANIVSPLPWIVTDIAVLIAPMPMIRNLNLPTKQRVALAGIFLIGGLTCIVSIVRYRFGFYSLADPTYDIVSLVNWTVIEANVTVLCAGLIASKPLAMFLLPDRLILKVSSCFVRPPRHLRRGKPTRLQSSPSQDAFRSQGQNPNQQKRSYELQSCSDDRA